MTANGVLHTCPKCGAKGTLESWDFWTDTWFRFVRDL